MKSWFPFYEYMIDSVKQKVRARVGTAKPEVNVGQAVELYVNPDRTDEFYCPTEKISCIQKVFTGVGVACLCLAVIMGVILYYCT